MSAFCVCYVAIALFGLCFAEGDRPVRPPICDTLNPLTTDTKVSYDRGPNPPVISRTTHNTTSIGIAWKLDANEQYAEDLCGFILYWYQEKTPNTRRQLEIKNPNETDHLFTDLQPGSKYVYYVVAYYTTQHEPRSWTLTTFTDGCGPDINECHPKGSERCNTTTGACVCKTMQTTGDNCEYCPDGFYMHSLGCTVCDQCHKDNVTSTGNCKPTKDPEDTMTCDCLHPYTGKHCMDCSNGFFWNDGVCVPCRCSPGHEDHDDVEPTPTCDPITGKCVCPKDKSGHNCETCADGYFGNALTDGCIHTRNAGVTALIVIVVLIIAAVAAVSVYLVCRRRIADRVRQGFFRAHLKEDYDKVNFTTLEEEPEFEPGRVKHLESA